MTLLHLSQDLYMRAQLMIDLYYRLALMFCCITMDGEQFSIAIGFRLVLVQLSEKHLEGGE